jgi:CBS domain-containing membrane protein
MEINDAVSSAARKMEASDLVSTVMSRSVVVASQSNSFSEVVELFSKHDMHHLPIVDEAGVIVGIVSSNDLMKVFTDAKYKKISLNTDEANNAIKIADIMTADVVSVSSTTTIQEAAKIFVQGKFLAMPVVDNGQIAGILSVRDLVYLIAHFA